MERTYEALIAILEASVLVTLRLGVFEARFDVVDIVELSGEDAVPVVVVTGEVCEGAIESVWERYRAAARNRKGDNDGR
jgi:endonuclease V-like protein UPF0215 family